MPKIFPVTVKRTTVSGGSGGPTATYAEDTTVADDFRLIAANPEDASVDDLFSVRTAVTEDASVDDLFSAIVAPLYLEDATVADDLAVRPSLAEDAEVADELTRLTVRSAEDATVADDITVRPVVAEDGTVNDLVVARIIDVDVPRTGTPDTDPEGDAWIDQTAGQTGVNHGNENLLVRGNQTAGANERRGFIEIDLTWSTGFNTVLGGFTISFTISTNAVINDTLLYSVSHHAARPFTESTVTWAAPPPAGTALTSGSLTAVVPAATRRSINIGAGSGLDAAIGRWLLFTFTAATAVLPTQFTIVSRDQAANRPTWSLDLQRGT